MRTQKPADGCKNCGGEVVPADVFHGWVCGSCRASLGNAQKELMEARPPLSSTKSFTNDPADSTCSSLQIAFARFISELERLDLDVSRGNAGDDTQMNLVEMLTDLDRVQDWVTNQRRWGQSSWSVAHSSAQKGRRSLHS